MKNIILSLALILFSFESNAKTFPESCPDISTCLKVVSELTGDSYVMDKEPVKCSYSVSENLELNKSNAVLLLTGVLNRCGLSRVPFGAKNVYRIEQVNDAKGMNVPSFSSNYDMAPKIPQTWDIARLEYKMKNPESLKAVENMLRAFAPMTARIYAYETNGTLVITEAGMILKDLYSFVRTHDAKISPELAQKWKDQEKERSQKSKK